MNETIKTLMTRLSTKSYTDEVIKKEDFDLILQAGTYAPSGKNAQASVIVATQNPELIQKLSKLNASILGTTADPFYGATSVAVVFAKKSVPTYLYDGALVCGNMLNAAASLGIGSCWIHRAKQMFETKEGKELLASFGLTEDYEGIANLVFGYAKVEPKAKPRKENYIIYK